MVLTERIGLLMFKAKLIFTFPQQLSRRLAGFILIYGTGRSRYAAPCCFFNRSGLPRGVQIGNSMSYGLLPSLDIQIHF